LKPLEVYSQWNSRRRGPGVSRSVPDQELGLVLASRCIERHQEREASTVSLAGDHRRPNK
jgi:hypothetical protein